MSADNTFLMHSFQGLPKRLRTHVNSLASEIGERNFAERVNLNRAGNYIHAMLQEAGYNPTFEEFRIDPLPWLAKFRTPQNKKKFLTESTYKNITATLEGLTQEVIVVGAHYDTVLGTPGADDNASGVAALIELARLLREVVLNRTIIFVAFANEEPPFFRTSAMGSAHFVESAAQAGKKMIFMISLEMLGFYSEEPLSQRYPLFLKSFYPNKANFIALVGNFSSRSYVKQMAQAFKEKCVLPVESIAAPRFVPGIDFSDQLNFWKKNIPAVMVTDTAFYRNAHYHLSSDLPSTLDYEKMAEVVKGTFLFLLKIGKVT